MKVEKRTILLWKDSFFCSLFGFAILGVLSMALVNLSFFKPLNKALRDFSFLDVYYAENLEPLNKVNTDVVLINIEQRDRFEIAQLLQKVNSATPKVVGVDMIFRDLKEPFSDSLLKNALDQTNIVMAFVKQEGNNIKSHSYFDTGQANGFVNLNFDNTTSVIRTFTAAIKEQDTTHYSFSGQIVGKLVSPDQWEQRNYSKVLPGDTPLRYTGNLDAFLTFGFDEFMRLDDISFLNQKAVLLGYLGSPTGNPYDVEDKHFTPLNKVTAGKSIPDMFGVVVHANIIAMLLKGDISYRLSNFWLGVISFLLSFAMNMFFIWMIVRDRVSYSTVMKIVQFLFSVIVAGISLYLFKLGYIVNAVPLIGIPLLSSSFIKQYQHFIRYIKSKRKWETYLRV